MLTNLLILVMIAYMVLPLLWTYMLLGVVQGATELLPVSSSGHLILTHAWLGATSGDLAFDALLHFATALAIGVYFRKDIARIVRSVNPELIALAVATIPAVIAGLLLEDTMATLFRSPELVAYMLLAGSVLMIGAEYMLARRTQHVAELNWKQAITVGVFQSLALIPGMSRSGMSMVGGISMGLSREGAARFGFLLGVPLLLGAGAKKTLDLGIGGVSLGMVAGAVVAAAVALLVIHVFLKFVRTHTLTPFIAYRVILAAAIILYSAH